MKNYVCVTLKTYTQTSSNTKEPRNVTLWYDQHDKTFNLLGNLEHNTELVIDQKLIDELQAILNTISED